jgi:hypothetical protein
MNKKINRILKTKNKQKYKNKKTKKYNKIMKDCKRVTCLHT